jgi:hypothetical protein
MYFSNSSPVLRNGLKELVDLTNLGDDVSITTYVPAEPPKASG